MEWTQERVIEFIDAYRKKEIIWDPKHPLHYNKMKKQDAWEELAKGINRPVNECKKKMENLLSALRREKMKMKKSSGTGKGRDEVYKSSWFAYKSLSFIMDKSKSRQMLNTIQKASKTSEGEEKVQSKAQEENLPEHSSEFLSLPPPRKKKKKEDQCLGKAFELLTTACSNQAINDECQHFGNMIAAKLRHYNDTVRCAIQTEIMGIFLNANRGYYDHYYHTHLQPINPLQVNFSSIPSKMCHVNIDPPPHSSPPSFHSKNPSPSYSQDPSPSSFNPYNSSSSQNFPAASSSPTTTSSEEDINIQELIE